MDIHRGKKVGVWLSVAAVLAPLAVQIAEVMAYGTAVKFK